MPTTQLPFDQIKAIHDRAIADGSPLGKLDLAGFSSEMQKGDQHNDWSAGHGADNIIGTVSRGIDSGIAATRLPDLTGAVTGFIGSGADALGGRTDQHYEQLARSVGEGLPRTLADLGLIMGGGALNAAAVLAAGPTGGASLAALAPGYAMMGAGVADAGVKGYSDTNSVKQGLTSAALTALAPSIAKVGSAAGIGIMGKFAPKLATSGAARVAASQIGQESAFLASDAADMTFNGNEFTMDNVFASAIGNIAMSPLMVQEGRSVYRNTPKAAAKTWTPEMGADQSVLGGAANNLGRLTDYLLGSPDQDVPSFVHNAGGLHQALELTGLDPAGLAPMQMISLLGKRRQGKELVQRLGENTPAEAIHPELIKKAGELLQTDDGSLVSSIRLLQTANAFTRERQAIAGLQTQMDQNVNQNRLRMSVGGEQLGPQEQLLLGNRQKNELMVHPTARTKEQAALAQFDPTDPTIMDSAVGQAGAEQAKQKLDSTVANRKPLSMQEKFGYEQGKAMGASPFDPAQQPYERNIALGEAPMGVRPQAVKGKLGNEFPDTRQQNLTGLRPEAVKGKTGDVQARSAVPEFSRVGEEPTGADSQGFFTTKSLGTELERLNTIEATPEMAQARLMQKVKNKVQEHVDGAQMPEQPAGSMHNGDMTELYNQRAPKFKDLTFEQFLGEVKQHYMKDAVLEYGANSRGFQELGGAEGWGGRQSERVLALDSAFHHFGETAPKLLHREAHQESLAGLKVGDEFNPNRFTSSSTKKAVTKSGTFTNPEESIQVTIKTKGDIKTIDMDKFYQQHATGRFAGRVDEGEILFPRNTKFTVESINGRKFVLKASNGAQEKAPLSGGLQLMSRAFDAMGLHPTHKASHMEVAERVLGMFNTGAIFGDTNHPDNGVLGAFYGVPSIKSGFTRLWRAEVGKTDGPVPDWMKGAPEQAEMANVSGRWFYKTRQEAQSHIETLDGGKMSYLDVPTEHVESFNARGNKHAGPYGREGNEYFVSRELADSRKTVDFEGTQSRVTINTQSKLFRNDIGGFNLLKTLAHEHVHSLFKQLDDGVNLGLDNFRLKHFAESEQFVSTLTPEQKLGMMTDTLNELIPKGHLRNEQVEELIAGLAKAGASTPREFLTDIAAMHLVSKASAEAKRNHLRFLPEPMQNFFRAVYRGVSELRQAVRLGAGERGIDLKGLDAFHSNLDMIFSKDPVLENMKSSIVKSQQVQSAIENGDLAGNSVQYSKVGIKVLDERIKEMVTMRQSNGLIRNIAQHMQISAGPLYMEKLPSYNKLTTVLARVDSDAVAMQHATDVPFMVVADGGLLKRIAAMPDGKLNPAERQFKGTIQRIEGSKEMVEKFNTLSQTFNDLMKEAQRAGIAYPTMDHPSILSKLHGLSQESLSDLKQLGDAYLAQSHGVAQGHKMDEVATMQEVVANHLLGAGIDYHAAKGMGVQLFDQMLSGNVGWVRKPDVAQGVTGILAGLPPDLATHPGAVAAFKHWEAVKPAFDQRMSDLDRPHITEFRSGMYGVRYNVAAPADGWPLGAHPTETEVAEQFKPKSGYRSTNDPTEWKAIQRDVAADTGNTITELVDHRRDPKGRFGQMQTRGLEEATRLVREHYKAAMDAMEPGLAKMFEQAGVELNMQNFDPAEPLNRAMRSMQGVMAERSWAPGREHMNYIEAQKAFSGLNARKLANNLARRESDWLLKDPAWQGDPKLFVEMQEFRNNILSGGKQDFQGFRKLTSFVSLAGNVAGGLSNAVQPLNMGVWRAAQEVGTAKALKYTAQGLIESFKPLDKMTDKRFKDIMVEAINRGHLKSGGSHDDFVSTDSVVDYNILKAGSSRDMVDLRSRVTDGEFLAHRVVEMFSKLGDKTMVIGMTPMRITEQLNNKNSLWVGYKLGLDQGLTGRPLFDKAVNFMQTVNIHGQRTAHSSFKMKAGQANGFVEAATLMTNYSVAMFSQAVSSWQGMLKSSGLDAATRNRSAQAFAGQVLTQMALAGVGGVGLKGLFAVVKDWFGMDPEDEIRKGMATIDNSGTLGQLLLNGALNTTTGVDLASRFDLTVPGLNPYTGFAAKGLFGAGGGLISALYNAPSQINKGDISKIQIIPTGIRKMITAFGDDAYKDASGQKIIDPTNTERFTQMLGFKPARMAQALEQRSTMRTIDDIANQRNSQKQVQQLALMQAGDMPSLMSSIQQDVMLDLQGSEYSSHSPQELKQAQAGLVREKMLSLVNHGVEKLLPFDPMSQGTGQTAQDMANSAVGFGNTLAPRQAEETRTLLKQQMMQKMGLKLPRNAPKAVRSAHSVDDILRANPTLTRSQAITYLQGQ